MKDHREVFRAETGDDAYGLIWRCQAVEDRQIVLMTSPASATLAVDQVIDKYAAIVVPFVLE